LPPRFFVDENMLPIGQALSLVRDDIVHPGHVGLPQVPLGTKDLVWLPIVGAAQLDLVVITRDQAIRGKAAELATFKANGVRGFFLTGKKDLTRWAKLGLLVRSWDRIERHVQRFPSGPWAMAVTDGRLSDLHL
jgi:hypothetical protein